MSKAWIVSEDCEGSSTVVFNNHGLAARRLGAVELDRDFDEVECRRAKEFDDYCEAGEVPPLALLEAGWWLECRSCHQRVCFDDEEFNKSEVTEAGPKSVYCSTACRKVKEG